MSLKLGVVALIAGCELASAFVPGHAPSMRAASLRMSSCDTPSRRDFLSAGVAAATIFGLGGSANAQEAKILKMEMDLEAPSEDEDKERIKREFQKIKNAESKGSSKPRWQQDLDKQKGKKAQAKKDVKNRDELCEVLGRGC